MKTKIHSFNFSLLIALIIFLGYLGGCAHIQVESPAAGFVREGTSLFNADKIDESAILFRKAYAADPFFAPAYKMLGRVYLAKGDNYRAEMFFRKSLALDSSNSEIYGWIGDIYWADGDTAGAFEYYQKCPKEDPHYAILHYRLGVREYQNGHIDKARNEFEKALEYPEFWGGHFGLGLISFSNGEYQNAATYFHEAERSCAEPEVSFWLAKSYRMQARDAEAYFYFKQFTNSIQGECLLCPEAEESAKQLKSAVVDSSLEIDTSLVIPFTVLEHDVLEVGIFDLEGRLVKSLFNGWITKGDYTLEWNGENSNGELMDNGVYLGCVERKFDLELKPILLEK
ncbi:tetratricopeptide repeat protein [bacterium]|nr:tetratricopeptide repeat protein [bacterium]